MFKQATFWILSLLSFSAYSIDITTISQQKLLQSNMDNLVIVDVRTSAEYLKGHVPNAINIPLRDIIDNPAILAPSEGKQIVLYCRSGHRASKAAAALQKSGMTNLLHLEGDMQGWLKADLPIQTSL